MGRVLCLDIGTRRTGVALSDETRLIAQGLPTIEHRDDARLTEQVAALVAAHDVDLLVVGLPLSEDGRPSTRSEQVRQLANRLRNRLKLPVEFQDERFSTSRALDVLEEAEGKSAGRSRPASKGHGNRRKQAADRIAAVLILEDWLAESERHATTSGSPLPGQGEGQGEGRE
ncbi:Holliday junction resolvase RuvX [candidate division WOR-3 bacterium]|nr:Holliday junction resolvase RuvX [candidate division WOR-3 bacterium]